MSALRGEVWWVDYPGLGTKPALVVSADMLSRSLEEVTVARVTRLERERALPTYVPLEPGEVRGLPERSFVICHNLLTVSVETLLQRAGALTAFRMVEVEDAIRAALDLEPTSGSMTADA